MGGFPFVSHSFLSQPPEESAPMLKNRFVLALALCAVGALALTSAARAGEEAPAAKPATSTEAPATTEAATKTPSPMHSLMGWVAKQVAPNLECPCPAKAEGEVAWRAWFAGGADVPLASLRDRFVADGWTADGFVAFFQKMAKSGGCDKGDCAKGDCAKGDCAKGDCAKGDCAKGDCAKGDCAKGDCAKGEGCCKGSGERADGKPCCGGCKGEKKAEGSSAPAAPAAEPVGKP
jgi:hypothetical protein